MSVREDKMLVCRHLDETWDGTDEPLPVRHLPRTELSRPSSSQDLFAVLGCRPRHAHVCARRNGFADLVIIRGERWRAKCAAAQASGLAVGQQYLGGCEVTQAGLGGDQTARADAHCWT